ncbi:insulinase family protein [Marinibactrum halimedae]|uniref:Peptidase M16 n=1 Tax=Marinibactrum halimedae TaxID=1444977 RepID=A0AA37WLV1_9GAMM|nr:insulinase family protein [Marinibactrum halimedae]MCD9461197.1 insulinase family protein [Marinibactrum halimedae]GLS26419.1 peptidase M16 [Marinibactrum halimedae]
MSPTAHPAFELIRTHSIDALNVNVEEYVHKKTGAQHIHLSADNNENVFLVALRTVPMDSTGVAHILEHTALCGSEKYPVRDPFFMMIRRSLNTFMNAFTSSDWTAYPFASQNRKDFNNLLDVYLDAVFFSRLDPLDFAQEGHRVEFEKADDPTSPLVYKGVVFNEMKGAMSSVPSQLWQTMCKYLFPTSTYHYNSGGEPECIPDLTYNELVHFYKNHYHPSNAIFMTYGDISAAEHQAKFEAQALSKFERLDYAIAVTNEKRYHAPLRVQEAYPLDDNESLEGKTHLVMGWLLGKSTDLESALKAQLLNAVLLDNSASPLQQALETTELGSSPSPMCGLDDSQKELSFLCGIEGSEAQHADAFEALVLGVLEDIATNGVPEAHVEACLHQLELMQREVGGDTYPYGLQLILNGLTAATHRGDPIGLLDIEPALATLRENIKDPEFIKSLARELLLDNPHRVLLTMVPDTKINARKIAAEEQRLAEIKAGLSDEQAQGIVELAKALQERQQQVDDESILPKVGVEDVPAELHYLDGERHTLGEVPLTTYAAGTNGLVYQQIVVDLPALDDDLKALLPFYAVCLTELGVKEKSYLETQQWQSQVAGSLHAFTTIRGTIDDTQTISGKLTLSGKALARNQQALSELMQATLEHVRFDEHARIRELLAQIRSRKEMSVTGSGHTLAMTAACAGMGPGAKISHELSGLAGIQSVKALDGSLTDENALSRLAEQLRAIHQLVVAAPRQYLVVGEQEYLTQYQKSLADCWATTALKAGSGFSHPSVNTTIRQAWTTNTQVNFCAKAYPTVPIDHPDAAPLTVLGGFLRNGILHRCIREQGGAYGGGASQDSNIAAFRFYSYRDPRLEDTLKDFDASLEWLQQHDHTAQSLEEAILGVVGALDKPSSPAGECKQIFQSELFGRNKAQRQRFRERVLNTTLEDLKRVAATYLTQDKANIAIITSSETAKSIGHLELETVAL